MNSTSPRILVIAGSTRTESLNARLARAAAAALRDAGAEVTLADLRDYPMPIYDGDLEETGGLPDAVRRLRRLVFEHDAIVLASPEYNASVAPLLKNALDWVSRGDAELPGRAAYAGKLALLLSASPGGFGGLRALPHLRAILEELGVWVMPQTLAVGGATAAFQPDGRLDAKRQALLEQLTRRLVAAASRLGREAA